MRRREETVGTPAPVPHKPATAPPRHTKAGAVEEFQIGEEPPSAQPSDVPAVADATPAIPLEPEPITEKVGKKPTAAKPKQVPPAKAPQTPPPPSEPDIELEHEYELALETQPPSPA